MYIPLLLLGAMVDGNGRIAGMEDRQEMRTGLLVEPGEN
jgi:hypothetical protein